MNVLYTDWLLFNLLSEASPGKVLASNSENGRVPTNLLGCLWSSIIQCDNDDHGFFR